VTPRRDDQHQVVGVLGSGGMANPCELLINAVKTDKPKMLAGLNQKVRGTVCGYPVSRGAATSSLRRTGRAYPTHEGACAERGKPVYLPQAKANCKGR
jgi:hypothetical protein